MNILEYALDVNKTKEEIMELCKRLDISVENEETILSDDDITLLDNEIQQMEDYIISDDEDNYNEVDTDEYDYELDEITDQDVYEGVESGNEKVTAYIYGGGYFNVGLTAEEINILSTYMIVEWFGYQLASIENTRMKFSGSDFKFTSQANHMQKLLAIKKDYEREGFHLQRLYKRRKIDNKGKVISTLAKIIAPQGQEE